jgi:hypothetical protein
MKYLLALALLVTLAFGATYYVAKTGDDGNVGTEVAPWLTVGKAAATIGAGDTAWVKAGTYVEADIQLWNAGTAADPSVLKSYDGWNTIIQGSFYVVRPCIRVEGFWIQKPSYGVRQIAIRVENTADSVKLCSLKITPITPHEETAVGIYCGWDVSDFNHGSTFCHNTISGFGKGGAGDGFYTHHMRQGQILYNTVSDCERNNYQIYNTCDTVEVAYNVSYGALHSTGILYDGKRGNIHHNISYGSPVGYKLLMEAGEGGHNKFWNNVAYNNYCNFALQDSGYDSVYNNLFLAPTGYQLSLDGAAYNRSWFDYNSYGVGDSFAGYANYAAWKAAWGQNAHSINVDPMMVDTAALNFRLLEGSPCIDVGWPLTDSGLDFDGESVPSGAGFDIGAFEYQAIPDSLDAGSARLVSPSGQVDSGMATTPKVWAKNYATKTVSFDVWLTIAPAYADTQTVTNLATGDSVEVNFDNWIASSVGVLSVRCSTQLTNDQNTGNDRRTSSVRVNPYGIHPIPMGQMWKFGGIDRRIIMIKKEE